jgi:hypothetical protein
VIVRFAARVMMLRIVIMDQLGVLKQSMRTRRHARASTARTTIVLNQFTAES